MRTLITYDQTTGGHATDVTGRKLVGRFLGMPVYVDAMIPDHVIQIVITRGTHKECIPLITEPNK